MDNYDMLSNYETFLLSIPPISDRIYLVCISTTVGYASMQPLKEENVCEYNILIFY